MNFRQMADRIGFSEDEFMELVELFLESSLAELDHINAAAKEMDFGCPLHPGRGHQPRVR